MSTISILILLLAVFTSSQAFRVSNNNIVLSPSQKLHSSIHAITIRGGDSDYDSEYDDESEEEENESKLSASTVRALKKAQAKKKAATKKTVSASLKSKKKSSGGGLIKKIPYIVRALANPFTVFAMTKGYFASLFNIDYLQQDQSQNLRSALQEKAKSAPTSGKRARKMRPGQAKTISDLPQLSA